MKQRSSSCVDLAAACQVLARSNVVQNLVRKHVGEDDYAAAISLMKSGNLDGDLGITIHDLLVDEIRNEATEVWSSVIRQPHEQYPLRVNRFHGVYWVWAMDYDPVGYFLNKREAVSFANINWV